MRFHYSINLLIYIIIAPKLTHSFTCLGVLNVTSLLKHLSCVGSESNGLLTDQSMCCTFCQKYIYIFVSSSGVYAKWKKKQRLESTVKTISVYYQNIRSINPLFVINKALYYYILYIHVILLTLQCFNSALGAIHTLTVYKRKASKKIWIYICVYETAMTLYGWLYKDYIQI